MTTPSRSQAENALAALLHCIRPDWATPGILAKLRDRPHLPMDVLAAAALWATHRRDQHSPHLIAEDDGAAWDRLIGKSTEPPTPTPTRGCPYHPGQPKDCPECAEYARTAITDPTTIAAIRAAARTQEEA